MFFETGPSNGSIVCSPDERRICIIGRMKIDKEKPILGVNPVTVPFFPPQIPWAALGSHPNRGEKMLTYYLSCSTFLTMYSITHKWICGNKMPTRCNRWFLLQILLFAQHVSGTIMHIIRSSRVLYRWLLPVVFGALVFKLSVWCGAEGCVSGLRVAYLNQ